MKKWLQAMMAGVIFLLLNSQLTSIASQDINTYSWPPASTPASVGNTTNSYSWTFVDSFNEKASDQNAKSHISVLHSNENERNPKFTSCESFSDPVCLDIAENLQGEWSSNVVINECKLHKGEYPCVESLGLVVNGESQDLKFHRYVDGSMWDPIPSRNIPPGGRASLWRDPNSQGSLEYLVIVSSLLGWQDKRVPVARENGWGVSLRANVIPTYSISADQLNADSHFSDCVWLIGNECGYRTDFIEKSRLTLSMNIPFGVSNFFIGRVFEPEVVMTQVNRNLINLKLSASPILIPMLRAELPASGAPSQIRRLYKPLTIDCPDGVNKQCSIQATSASGQNKGKEAFEKFSLFEPFLGDRASKMIPMWSFQNYPANTKRCHPFGSFKGLVSTNAAIYDGEPPKLIDGELVYKVAGTHHDASGNVFSGTYDLILQSQVARCYYGLNKNPIQASVSIESRSGEKKIKTVSLREKDGYIRLSVGGFTFSQPTIKVVFSQAPASTPSPTATSSSSTSDSVTSIKDSHSVITCIKGGKTKKVSGVKPKCPKGFKKR